MTHIESLGGGVEVWDFEAGYVHQAPLEDNTVSDSQEPIASPATDLLNPPIWPHSY